MADKHPPPPSPSPPSPELTEQQKQIVEANRLRALAKRKAFISQQQQQHHHLNDQNGACWRQFKCRKLDQFSNSTPKLDTLLPKRFRVRLEICSPDSFSVTPQSIQGSPFLGQEHCFRVLEDCLSNAMLTHYTQIHDGGEASVYTLRDYELVLKCLKNCKDIEVEEILWTTYNVVEKLSHGYCMGRWVPCRPEHLPDEKVEELIDKLPRKLLSTLLPFQLDGLKFGLRRGGRCLIADEMGLGKTLQAIAIASCFSKEGSILVVCPAILRYSWAEELEHWLPSCTPADIHLVFGRKNNPVHLKKCPKIVVISYTMLHRLRESMLQLKWGVLIIDESHHIRCSKKKSESREISAVARIRNALEVATKTFFDQFGFLSVRTPIITTSDCEGAGEMFQDTTLISEMDRIEKELIESPSPSEADIEAAKLMHVVSVLYIHLVQLSVLRRSHSSRHLSEFWMVEPELAFAELKLRLLDHFLDDMEFMAKKVDKAAIERLNMVASTPFERITYTDAVTLLEGVTDKKFENKVEWGIDLASEHERYLTEVSFKKPVIFYDYPKDIKAFYMRLNEDGKTVAAMDLLVPKVGELVGGSQREERYNVMVERMTEMGLPLEAYKWYLDLRLFGTVKHSGFGLGFERMLMFATGLDNIRDVLPFPRYPGRADL